MCFSVFAYGATGAGKTYTMLGAPDNPGLTFLTVMELYRRLEQLKEEYEAEVVVAYLEVSFCFHQSVSISLEFTNEQS